MPKRPKYNESDFEQLPVRRMYSVGLWWIDQNRFGKLSHFLAEIGSHRQFFDRVAKGSTKNVTTEMVDNAVKKLGVNANYFYDASAPMFLSDTSGKIHQEANNSNTPIQAAGDINGNIHVGNTIMNGLDPKFQQATLEVIQELREALLTREEELIELLKKNPELLDLAMKVAGGLREPA